MFDAIVLDPGIRGKAFTFDSFWGVFGWQRLWMPGIFYNLFAGLTLAGIIGGGYAGMAAAVLAATSEATWCRPSSCSPCRARTPDATST